MNVPYTLFDYHQRITEFFSAMLNNPEAKSTLEALGGKPFDIQNLSINDFTYSMSLASNSANVEEVVWKVGDWTFKFQLTDCSDWIRRTDPDAAEMDVSVYHADYWAYREQFRFDRTQPLKPDSEELLYFIHRIIGSPKRRISITIREVEKYLANPGYYDTLKAVLKIKPRKK